MQVPSAGVGHWPPLENVTASPAALKPTMIPMAPASLSARTFSLTLQSPRVTNAILPTGFAAYVSPKLNVQPRPTNTTDPLIGMVIGAQSIVAVLPYDPAIDAGVLMTSGMA